MFERPLPGFDSNGILLQGTPYHVKDSDNLCRRLQLALHGYLIHCYIRELQTLNV